MTVSELRSIRAGATPVRISTSGRVTETQRAQAANTIERVVRRHRVESPARVRISGAPCADGPALVQVNLDFGGVPVRAQAIGPGAFATTFVAERLDRILAGVTAGAVRPRWPDPWRPQLAVPTEARPIVRRKVCAVRRVTVAEATVTLEAMDYDAHLFTDRETGMDAVVHRAGPWGVRLARQHRLGLPAGESLALTVNPLPTAYLSESEAAERLCRYGLPFVFCTDPRDNRGRLLYRRYDGDLGLIAPRHSIDSER
ncbi:sigma 54 modulation/S30EA ribosomal C-terminal domain-containing protein [Nocardia sp. NPDC051756]|uniref:sigma 54 modulation/S30EA ribosomal C-terminal domain-containing protein n=1 Tax=Nocardia sp. NPDC051756 TaxID=3154751 RepID=UPI0034296441